jgi:lysosomal acid lipase/cholesteryl ester hydrolase
MTNSRGNTYSQGHKNLSNKNPDFWDFSFSDMIKKDVPACIDYVLQQTGEKDLAYIGHSQGASIMFGLLGSPAGEKYNALVKPFIALAPVTSFKFMSRPYRLLGKIPFLDKILGLTKSEFMPSSYLTKMLSSQMCPLPIKQLCMNPLLAVNGFDKDHINMTRMGVYSTGFPAGTSTKNLKHYLQLLKTGVFKDFDYGHDENRLHYEQLTPPVFEVSRIGGYESPQIAIINSFDDFMATPGDVNLLRKEIGVTPICDRVLYARNWNHMDFLYGMQQHDYVNSLVYKILENKKC